MRYECDEPAFAGDYVEFSDSFSRAQVRAVWAAYQAQLTLGESGKAIDEADAEAAEETLLSTLRPKILAIHLTCVDADAITRADDLTPARTGDIDTRLYAWWSNVWLAHLSGLADLGKALGRRLFITSATIATMEAVPVSQNHS